MIFELCNFDIGKFFAGLRVKRLNRNKLKFINVTNNVDIVILLKLSRFYYFRPTRSRQNQKGRSLPGFFHFIHDQLFFFNIAQVWLIEQKLLTSLKYNTVWTEKNSKKLNTLYKRSIYLPNNDKFINIFNYILINHEKRTQPRTKLLPL